MNLTQLPVVLELFSQWRQARGEREEPARRPFSRRWETLLEDANLLSSAERLEAERDVRGLAKDGWVELRSVPYKPHLIDRVLIPLAQEEQWQAAFGFARVTDAEAGQIRTHLWHPDLEFIREARMNLRFAELRKIDTFLHTNPPARPVIPIKERSLQVLGDEKRLDVLRTSALFRSDRLDLERHLRCEITGEPLGWKRGARNTGQVIVIENAATWNSYCRWNELTRNFSAVVYGRGLQTAQSTRYLGDILAEFSGRQRVFYFGDLDLPGLQIPQQASAYAEALGLPSLEAHLPSYRWLLELGRDKCTPWEGSQPARKEDCLWLGDLAEEAWALVAAGRRLAQEHVSWEFLQTRLG